MTLNYIYKFLVIIVTIASLTTCTNREGRFTTVGHVADIKNNQISIVTIDKDTLRYSTEKLISLSNEPIFLKDSVLISYIDTLGQNNATSILVISHNLPNINNRSAMLIGTWQSTISQYDTVKFMVKFKVDSTVEITDNGGYLNQNWFVEGDSIMLSNGYKLTQKYNLIRVDNATLTLNDGARVVHFSKID